MQAETQAVESAAAAAPITTVPKVTPKPIKANKRPGKAVVTKTAAKGKTKTATKAKGAIKAKARKPAGDRLVPIDLENYTVDKVKKTAGGNPSIDSDDKIAQMLRGKPLDQVYVLVASKLEDTTVGQLKAKYGKLNLGMQRMNLGNRLRGVLNAK